MKQSVGREQGMRMNIEERLKAILTTEYKVPAEKLAPDARLDELGVDSLGMIELLFKLEDELHIKVPTDDTQLSTVGDVIAFLNRLVAEQGAQQRSAGGAQ